MTTDFGGFLIIFEECMNFEPAYMWGDGKGRGEAGVSKSERKEYNCTND